MGKLGKEKWGATVFGIPITRSSNVGTNKSLSFEDMYKQITDYKQSNINDYTNLFWDGDYKLQTKPVEKPFMRGKNTYLTIYDEFGPFNNGDWVRDAYYKTPITPLLKKAGKEANTKYNAGDIIKVTGWPDDEDIGSDCDGDIEIGGHYKVQYDGPDTDGDVRVRNARDTDHWFINQDYVELVTPINHEEQIPEIVLKVGDKVQCIGDPNPNGDDQASGGAGWKRDKIFTIDRFTNDNQILWPTDRGCGVWRKWVKLVNNNEGDNEMSDVTSNPVKAIMENELDADTRLLRQIGFENNDGSVADYGRQAVIQSLYAERRADFATKYRKALATEDAAAKQAKANADKA